MKLYLVRHGQTDWNVAEKIQGKTDIPLNATGLRQARETAEALRAGNYQIHRVYTSYHRRAAKTARIIGDTLQVPCEILEGIHEMSFGEWEGMSWTEVQENYPDYFPRWHEDRLHLPTPGGECYEELMERVWRGFLHVLDTETENVAVVTHSAVIMTLRCHVAGDRFQNLRSYNIKNAQIVELTDREIRSAYDRWLAR